VIVCVKIASGIFISPEPNLSAGNTLPRAEPAMSGTNASTSSMFRFFSQG
jgi:hypothetical protein